MEEAPRPLSDKSQEKDKYGLTVNEKNYTVFDSQYNPGAHSLLPEIWLIAISFMRHPDDAISFMLTCKFFFLLTKQYDLKTYEPLFLNKVNEAKANGENDDKWRQTLIEIDDNATARKELITEFNKLLHSIFSSTEITPEERNNIIQEIANTIVVHKPTGIMLEMHIQTINKHNKFIELYNKIIDYSLEDDAFDSTILDLITTMNRVIIFHAPVTPLRLYSLAQSGLDKENHLAQRMTDNGEITYSKGFELIRWTLRPDTCTNFTVSLMSIAINTALTFPYFIKPFQRGYNQYNNQMMDIDCKALFSTNSTWGINCQTFNHNYLKLENCTGAFSRQSSNLTFTTCHLAPNLFFDSPEKNIASYALTSLGAGILLAFTANFAFKSSGINLMPRIIVLIPGVAFNIALPYLAQETAWSSTTAYYAGCAGGCGLNSYAGAPFQSSSYIFEVADNINPVLMGVITTAGVLAIQKISGLVEDWIKGKSLSDKLQKNPTVRGLLRYGTFAQQEEKGPEPIAINVEDSNDEMSSESSEEEYNARCGSSCTLF